MKRSSRQAADSYGRRSLPQRNRGLDKSRTIRLAIGPPARGGYGPAAADELGLDWTVRAATILASRAGPSDLEKVAVRWCGSRHAIMLLITTGHASVPG